MSLAKFVLLNPKPVRQRPAPNTQTAMARMSAKDRAAMIATRMSATRKTRFPSGDFQ